MTTTRRSLSKESFIRAYPASSAAIWRLLPPFMKAWMAGKNPFVCNVCKKIFSKKCNLTSPGRVHSGERPYVCRFCQKGFTQRGTLIMHERLHTGEIPFVCGICQKGFKHRSQLVKHGRWHTGQILATKTFSPKWASVVMKCRSLLEGPLCAAFAKKAFRKDNGWLPT